MRLIVVKQLCELKNRRTLNVMENAMQERSLNWLKSTDAI